MLTFTLRYFLGSCLIAASSPRNSSTLLFMFSYNCLSFSNRPRRSLTFVQLRNQVVQLGRHPGDLVVQLAVGDQPADPPVAVVDLVGQGPDVVRRLIQRRGEGIV